MKSKLWVLLAEKRLSMRWLEKELGIHRKHLSAIANGDAKRFEVDELKKLCEFFNKPIQDIIYFEDDSLNAG